VAPTLWWTFAAEGSAAGDFIVARTGLDDGGWPDHLLGPLMVIGATLGALILPWLAIRFGIVGAPQPEEDQARRLETMLAVTCFGPLLVIALGALVLGVEIKDHWLLVHFLFLTPWLLLRARRTNAGSMRFRRRGEALVLGAVLAIMLIYPLERQAAYWGAEGEAMYWTPLMPAEPLAQAAREVWREGLEAQCLPPSPVRIVGGAVPAAIVASSLSRRAQWLEHFDLGLSPWVDDGTLGRTGALAIGAGGRALEKHGLVRAASRQYEWLNARGGEGRTITIAAYLPASACL